MVRGVRAGSGFAGCLLPAGRVAGRVVRARESHRLHSLWRPNQRRREDGGRGRQTVTISCVLFACGRCARPRELEEVPMPIVSGLDIHPEADHLRLSRHRHWGAGTGADRPGRAHLAGWLAGRFAAARTLASRWRGVPGGGMSPRQRPPDPGPGHRSSPACRSRRHPLPVASPGHRSLSTDLAGERQVGVGQVQVPRRGRRTARRGARHTRRTRRPASGS
jgi:hypothetical protein